MKALIRRVYHIFGTRRNQSLLVLVVFVVGFGVLFVARQAEAATGECGIITGNLINCIRDIVGSILQLFIWVIGSLVFLMMRVLLIPIAQYNNFVTSNTVELGWSIVRDLTNMFFVLAMLIIAFSTILGVQQYYWKNLLPRLLIMAVVINFSKVIVGVFIDFSQVIMLTFINGFAAAGGANLVNLLGITSSFNFVSSTGAIGAINNWDTVAGMFLAVVMLGLALAAVVIFAVVLGFRIVMLWILTILSPLAFFLSVFPGKGSSLYGQWWTKFGNYLVMGPVLAFFLWLSFATAGSGDIARREGFKEVPQPPPGERSGDIPTQAGQPINMTSFIIGLALLMGGMMMAGEMGVMGGSAIAGAANWVKDKGVSAIKSPAKGAMFAIKDIDSRLKERTGISLNVPGWFKGMGAGLKERQDLRYKRGEEAAKERAARGGIMGRLGALTGDPQRFFKDYGLLGAAALPIQAGAALTDATAQKVFGRKKSLGHFRTTEYYSGKSEEYKGKRVEAEGEIEKIQQERAAFVQKYMATIDSDIADLLAQAAAAVPGSDQQKRLDGRANELKGLKSKATAGEAMSEGDLGQLAKRSNLFRESMKRDKSYQTISAREQSMGQVRDGHKAIEEDYRARAVRSAPKGLPPEFGKHLSGEELKDFAERALRDGDAAGFTTVVKTAAAQDPKSFLESFGVGADAKGIRGLIEREGTRIGMSKRQQMELATEFSATAKANIPAAAGVTKIAAGGVKQWGTETDQEQARLRAKGGPGLTGRMKDGTPIGTLDKNGKATIDDTDIAAIVHNLAAVANKLSKPQDTNRDQLQVFVQQQQQILNRVANALGGKTSAGTNPAFVELERQLKLLNTKMAALPPSLKQTLNQVKATAGKP